MARVFAELVCHIENCVENGTHIFKLSELHSLFSEHLQNLGFCKGIHKTVLKNQLLDHFSEECQAQSDGKNCLLVFHQGFKKFLRDSTSFRDFESEAFLMTKLVKLMRKEIFDTSSFHFSGDFPSRCQENSVPTMLKTFMSMLLSGPNLQHKDDHESQAYLTISQLICFNTKSKRSCAENNRHSKDREMPLPLYIGLNLHTQTRSKNLVNNLHKLGISISYKRVIELENHLASAICERFQHEDIVCPSHLRKGLFTVGALDNINHNPSSTTAQGSFHGTAISIFQFPTTGNAGILRDPLDIPSHLDSPDYSLPESYVNVPAVTTKINELIVPPVVCTDIVDSHLKKAKEEEVKWTDHSAELLAKDKLDVNDFLYWAAFNASTQPGPEDPTSVVALLPLFFEKAATIAMIKHGMDVLKKITNNLNTGQTPWLLISHFLPWQNMFNGLGHSHLKKILLRLCSEDSILKWLCGVPLTIF